MLARTLARTLTPTPLLTRPLLLRPLPHLTHKRWSTTPTVGGAGDYQFGPANDIQPTPSTQALGYIALTQVSSNSGGSGSGGEKGKKEEKEKEGSGGGKGGKGGGPGPGLGWKHSGWRAFEAAATTGVSLGVLGLAGFAYHRYYKYIVLQKIDHAFNQGDPALKLALACYDKNEQPWITLEEQDQIDRIISGSLQGHYYLLIGEKGTGKTSMLLAAMDKTHGEACSIMEAHGDPEIFRLRLGKALDFEFHEDYIGSLFSIRGPRDTTALLDIERALNKLEKVALGRRKATGKPLVLIINSMHLLRNDDNGKDLLELLQQKAEAWAANGLVTVVFNSDDYWVYERLKQYASRMQLISVRDLPRPRAIEALAKYRRRYFREEPDQDVLEQVYKLVGGRLAFLHKVARERNMLEKCREICEDEKTWLMNKCGLLGTDMDDDVMDQQKFASAAMVLVRELVRMAVEQQKDSDDDDDNDDDSSHRLPELPLYRARQIMTRAEFIQEFDHINIFTIDWKSMVRADSVPMMNAFIEVAQEEGFDEYLEDTLQRISDIESLGRTRELVLKDLWYGGRYNMTVKDRKGNVEKVVQWDVTEGVRPERGEE